MDTDLMFVSGVVLLGLAIPSVLSAYADSRPPRAAVIILMIGGVLVIGALGQKPGGIALADIPDMFFRVIGRILH